MIIAPSLLSLIRVRRPRRVAATHTPRHRGDQAPDRVPEQHREQKGQHQGQGSAADGTAEEVRNLAPANDHRPAAVHLPHRDQNETDQTGSRPEYVEATTIAPRAEQQSEGDANHAILYD